MPHRFSLTWCLAKPAPLPLSLSTYRTVLATLLLASVATGAVADAVAPEAGASIANIIIGGAERRCSSFNGSAQGKDCLADWATILAQDPAFAGLTPERISFEPEPTTPAFSYSLTRAGLAAFADIPSSLLNPHRKQWVLEQLNQRMHDAAQHIRLTWAAFELLLPRDTLAGDYQLTPSEIARLRSALVDPGDFGPRKLQGRSNKFSSNAASVAIMDSFVAAARAHNAGKRPLIGVITASADAHPFADRDINMFAIASAGADLVYLPLEGGYRHALDAQDCAHVRDYYDWYANTNPPKPVYHADLLFRELSKEQQQLCANNAALLNATLERVNGIYFSGGDQSRHLESLVGKDAHGDYVVQSPQLAILQRRHAQGQLVVAGTSAGNHAQGGGVWRNKTVPMIGGGDSYDVLEKGFSIGDGPVAEGHAPLIYPRGGLGLFHFGVLDSHFSKRTREARLVRAVSDSAMDYGFGVDENTALIVSQADASGATHFSVLGAGGVFIVDLRESKSRSYADKHFSIDGARGHYLLPGDHAAIDASGDLRVRLQDAQPALPVAPDLKRITRDQILDYGSYHFLQLATAMGLQGAQQALGTTRNSADTRSRQDARVYCVSLTRDARTRFQGGADAQPGTPDRVSYTGLVIGLAPCDGAT